MNHEFKHHKKLGKISGYDEAMQRDILMRKLVLTKDTELSDLVERGALIL